MNKIKEKHTSTNGTFLLLCNKLVILFVLNSIFKDEAILYMKFTKVQQTFETNHTKMLKLN